MIIKTKIYDLTKIFEDTKSKIIRKSIEKGGKIFGIKLDKFSGLLSYEISPNRRIGTELADVAKAFGLGGIFHSDELPNYGISEEEVKKVKEVLNCKDKDAFIIVTGPENKCKLVLKAIVERLNEMIRKVPKDTRKANLDGTTSFLRPQPGSSRMYPETDHPLIILRKELNKHNNFEEIKYEIEIGKEKYELKIAKINDVKRLIEKYWEFKSNYDFILDLFDPEKVKELLKTLGVKESQIEKIIWSEKLRDFIELSLKYKVKPSIIYYLIEDIAGELKKQGMEYKYDRSAVEKILKLLESGKIVKSSLPKIIEIYLKENMDIEKIIKKYGFEKISGDKLKEKVIEIIKDKDIREFKKAVHIVMEKLRYRAEGSEIIKILKEYFENASKDKESRKLKGY